MLTGIYQETPLEFSFGQRTERCIYLATMHTLNVLLHIYSKICDMLILSNHNAMELKIVRHVKCIVDGVLNNVVLLCA